MTLCTTLGEKIQGKNRETQNVGHSTRKFSVLQNVSIMKKKKKSQTVLGYRRAKRKDNSVRSWIKKQK